MINCHTGSENPEKGCSSLAGGSIMCYLVNLLPGFLLPLAAHHSSNAAED
jgi:hypothetical protein